MTPNDCRSTPMGSSGADVLLSERAIQLLSASFECKSHKEMAIYSMFDQCRANCPDNSTPVLVVKQDYGEPLAIIPLDYYFQLVKNAKT